MDSSTVQQCSSTNRVSTAECSYEIWVWGTEAEQVYAWGANRAMPKWQERNIYWSRMFHLSRGFTKAPIFQYLMVITFVWQQACGHKHRRNIVKIFNITLLYCHIYVGHHISGCLRLCLLLKWVHECMRFCITECQPTELSLKFRIYIIRYLFVFTSSGSPFAALQSKSVGAWL